MTIPKKALERLIAGLKHYQPILESARKRDVNEYDTVVIVTDVLAEIFGYDKYSEITREHSIRGTFCDLAIKIEDELQLLIEVKAIGGDLKDSHVKQAVDYAANQGAEWVILTNGIIWKVFRVIFGKPIDKELVIDLNLSTLSTRNQSDMSILFPMSREGWLKAALPAFHTQQQATNRFFLAAVLLNEPALETLRRELRRLAPDAKIEIEDLRKVLIHDVLKREVTEGIKAEDAQKKVQRSTSRPLRARKSKEERDESEAVKAPAKD
jgi:hypothetical protein